MSILNIGFLASIYEVKENNKLLPTEYEVPINICNTIKSKNMKDFESLFTR